MANKHLVIYSGKSLWKDAKGELWGKSDNKQVKDSRTFESAKGQAEFLEDRKDIAFMINYGEMKIESVGIKPADGEPVEVKPVEAKPSTDSEPVEVKPVEAKVPAGGVKIIGK